MRTVPRLDLRDAWESKKADTVAPKGRFFFLVDGTPVE
jgi:hypothetical protein